MKRIAWIIERIACDVFSALVALVVTGSAFGLGSYLLNESIYERLGAPWDSAIPGVLIFAMFFGAWFLARFVFERMQKFLFR